ncbi:MAG: aspartate aminotransferase family protein [Eubacterium sp.]|nr:aspartate aminotransferase family protein [Candidatus Colimonas fimequi]
MDKIQIQNLDKEKIVGTYGRYDLAIDHGKGSRCVSVDGKEYIDFTSGIGVNCLGYCNDGWVKAVTEQLMKLQHCSNLFYSEPQVKVADALTKRTGMSKVFFGNSGAEANEASIKTARKYGTTTKGENCNKIISLVNSFHGRTIATITATGQDKYHKYFTPFLDGFKYCPANDLETLESLVDDDVCAIMMEMVQGEGGVLNLDADFVKAVADICAENDILFIADEVQTGIGRTGKFFAYEAFGIQPDIVSFAKGIGGGLPIGGALFGPKTCNVLQPGDHGTTYGGNPVAAAGAAYVLSVLDDEFLAEVTKKGEYIKAKLMECPKVKSVSGMGLMMGIEIEEGMVAGDVVKAALENGLMSLTAKDKIRLLPPLNISYEDIDAGLEILIKAIEG